MRFLPLVWRNLARSPVRSLLTAGAIALAAMLVCLLRTMPAGLDLMLSEFSSNARVSVVNRAGLVYSMPYAYLSRVKALPGVDAAASWTWFGGVYDADEGVTFPNFAIEPDAAGAVWPDWEISEEDLERFRTRRNGALVGQATLDRYGWEIGDDVTLEGTVFPLRAELVVAGAIPVQSPYLFMQREYLDQALKALGARGGLDFAGMLWLRVEDPARVDPLRRSIDDLFRNSEAPTLSETEKSYYRDFFSFLQDFVTVILIVTGLVAACIVFIAANTASIAVRERAGEIAVLRALGFGRRLIFGTLVAEAALLSGVAGAAGALASFGLTSWLRSMLLDDLGPLGSFVVTPAIAVQGVFLGLFVGILAGAVPGWGAARRPVASALREIF